MSENWACLVLAQKQERIEQLEKEVERLKGEQGPKKCGCGASVRDCPGGSAHWKCTLPAGNYFMMKDGWHCIMCGEELKA